MIMVGTIFIGELPPPYGGVAVKDKLVFQEVYQAIGAEMIDLVECKRHPFMIPVVFWKIIWGMLRRKNVIIGVGTHGRRKVLLQMQKLLGGSKGLSRVHILAMGGTVHLNDAKDIKMQRLMQKVGSVWVETEGMVMGMKDIGVSQTYIFPNCRPDECAVSPSMSSEGKLRLVFFSRICAEKGVDIIIEAYKSFSQNCSLDFYGEVAEEFHDAFQIFLHDNPSVRYHGVFDSTNGNVYKELNQYDVMLLLSRWKGEGVPGALVEAKMAGITAIVSDWNYNSEIVLDNREGIVLKETSADGLLKAIKKLSEDRRYTDGLKKGAFESRVRYCIRTYKERLADILTEENRL